jgi:RNase P/RNase MRP subunit p29
MPPVEELAQVPRRTPPPGPERAMARQAPSRTPAQEELSREIHLPAFTFRTLDGKAVKVQINGEDLSTTPCLWSITPHLKSTDAAIPPGWPPEGGRFVATTQHPDDPESKAELYIIDKADILAKIPKLRKGECVLAVRGTIGRVLVQGSLLLYLPEYRYTTFVPLINPEGDDASRFQRTLWFERTPDE